ncbi:MAG: protein kinase [Deltaproteobacteria bacterium]|nr:protein kinase [Deltaproteobacteria bacterium]
MPGEPPGRFGKYAVVRKIASGGMADVYLCRYEGEAGFRKRVAVKAIHPKFSGDPRFRGLFVREARLAASFSHPNLVQVFDFGREGDSYFLAMEYVEGWNLAQAFAQARQRSLPVPIGVWRHWILGILSAVGFLHRRGVLHRDLTPSNVLLSRGGAVMVADFGIALAARWGSPAGNPLAGKAGYLAPELAGGGNGSASSDLFAVAVIAAELLLERRLFEGRSREEVLTRVRAHDERSVPLDGVPALLRPVIARGLAVDPARRFASASEFAGEISRAIPESIRAGELESYWDLLFPLVVPDEETVAVGDGNDGFGPTLVRERRALYGKGRGRILGIGIASALVAAGVGGVILWRGRGPEPARVVDPSAGSSGTPARESSQEPSSRRPHAELPRDKASPEREPKVHSTERGEPPVMVRGGRPAQTAGRPAPDVPMESNGDREGRSVSTAPPIGVVLETDPPGAMVLLEDGTRLGRTPLSIDVQAWRGNRITLEMEGYDRRTVPVGALAGMSRFRMELERQMGTVDVIQAIPWAKVYEGDRYLGDTPMPSVKLPAGEHRLRFVNEPLGVEKTETIVVLPGRNPKLIVTLVGGAAPPPPHP